MRAEEIIHCNSCKVNVATAFVQGTLEIIQGEKYRLKLVSLALCDDCIKILDTNTVTGMRMAECLTGGKQ